MVPSGLMGIYITHYSLYRGPPVPVVGSRITRSPILPVLLLFFFAAMQYCHCLLYWPGYIHVVTEVAQWEQGFFHGGS